MDTHKIMKCIGSDDNYGIQDDAYAELTALKERIRGLMELTEKQMLDGVKLIAENKRLKSLTVEGETSKKKGCPLKRCDGSGWTNGPGDNHMIACECNPDAKGNPYDD